MPSMQCSVGCREPRRLGWFVVKNPVPASKLALRQRRQFNSGFRISNWAVIQRMLMAKTMSCLSVASGAGRTIASPVVFESMEWR